ncbi:MAG: hypothetical protein Q8S84_05965 [bacterium]|nr:hypothetical protein [bacterium]
MNNSITVLILLISDILALSLADVEYQLSVKNAINHNIDNITNTITNSINVNACLFFILAFLKLSPN